MDELLKKRRCIPSVNETVNEPVGDNTLPKLKHMDVLEVNGKVRYITHRGGNPGFCYIMKDDNYPSFYKIGKSKRPKHRESTLLHDAPTISLYKVVWTNDMSVLEYNFHQILCDKRYRGEWFKMTDNELKIFVDVFKFYDYDDAEKVVIGG